MYFTFQRCNDFKADKKHEDAVPKPWYDIIHNIILPIDDEIWPCSHRQDT